MTKTARLIWKRAVFYFFSKENIKDAIHIRITMHNVLVAISSFAININNAIMRRIQTHPSSIAIIPIIKYLSFILVSPR